MAPKPPLDLPLMALWAGAARVRKCASIQGTTSLHRYEWYMPVPGESTNWLPP